MRYVDLEMRQMNPNFNVLSTFKRYQVARSSDSSEAIDAFALLACLEQLTATDQAWKETDDMLRLTYPGLSYSMLNAVRPMTYEEKAEAGESPWWRWWFGGESEHAFDLRTSRLTLTTVSGIDHTAAESLGGDYAG